jgi:hypothetical protein
MEKELLLLASKVAKTSPALNSFKKLTSYLDDSFGVKSNVFSWNIDVKQNHIRVFFKVEILKEEGLILMSREDYYLDSSSKLFLQSFLGCSVCSLLIETLRDKFELRDLVEINSQTVDTIIERFESFKKKIVEL